jgi:hypothetical protein
VGIELAAPLTGSPPGLAARVQAEALAEGLIMVGRPSQGLGHHGESLRSAAARVEIVLQLPDCRQRQPGAGRDVHLRHARLSHPAPDRHCNSVPVLAARPFRGGHAQSLGAGAALIEPPRTAKTGINIVSTDASLASNGGG